MPSALAISVAPSTAFSFRVLYGRAASARQPDARGGRALTAGLGIEGELPTAPKAYRGLAAVQRRAWGGLKSVIGQRRRAGEVAAVWNAAAARGAYSSPWAAA
jgi:hypothetical protein